MSFLGILDNDIIELVELSKTLDTLEDHSRRNRPLYRKLKTLTSFLPTGAGAKQRLWHIEQDTVDIPKCIQCNLRPVSWVVINKQYNRFCSSKCAHNHPSVLEQTKQTNLANYGVEWNLTSASSKQKKDITCMDRYGVTDVSVLNKIKRARKQTMIERYGVKHNWATGSLRDGQKQTMLKKYGAEYPIQNSQIKTQIKQTNLEKYDVEWNITSASSKDKRAGTCINAYGVSNAFGDVDIQEKIKQTNLEKYGFVFPGQSPEVREKTKQTNLEKYGVEHNWCTGMLREAQMQRMVDKYGLAYIPQHHMISILPLVEDYGWLSEQYVIQGKTATQIGKELGICEGTVCRYLRKADIDIRQIIRYSYACINWLESIMETDEIYIQHALNGGEYQIPGTRYKADGYCQGTNTIYEFHGDYWHGNPEIYAPDHYNKSLYKTMGELYQNTIERENQIKELGYSLVVMWESEYNTNKG